MMRKVIGTAALGGALLAMAAGMGAISGPSAASAGTLALSAQASAPAPAPTCSKEDIDGNWYRSDGATVPIVGIDAGFRDGATAIMFGHPDAWPKGHSKFIRIFRDGGPQSCRLKAVCAGYDINRRTGQTFRRERECVLTIDPVKKTMRESGASLIYTRDSSGAKYLPDPAPAASASPPAPAPVAAAAASAAARPAAATTPVAPTSVPVPSAQEQAELAARQKLNREQAAFASKQLADNKAAQEAFEQAKRDREAAIARQQAEHRAEVARREREHAAAMARWEADVAACKAGDNSRCAAPGTPR